MKKNNSYTTKRVDPLVPTPAPTTYDVVPPEVQPNAELSENEA